MHRQVLPFDPRTRLPEMQVLGYQPAVHRQQYLDQARDTRGGFQVADIRLHRPDQQGPTHGPAPAVDGGRRPHLNRVAQLRPRPVRLQVVHLRGLQSRARERLRNHAFLGRPVRNGQAGAGSVLVDGRAPDDAPDPVPVVLGVAQALQDQHPAALAAPVPVRRGVERLAAAVPCKHPGIRVRRGRDRSQDRVRAARQREVGLAAL